MDITPPDKFTFDPALFEAGRYWARRLHGQSEADRLGALGSQLQTQMAQMPLIGSKYFKNRITGGDGTDLKPMYQHQQPTRGAHTRIGVILHNRGPNPVFAPKPGMSRAADKVAQVLEKQGIKRVPTLTESELAEIERDDEQGGGGILDPMQMPPPSYDAAKHCGEIFARDAIKDARAQAADRKRRRPWWQPGMFTSS